MREIAALLCCVLLVPGILCAQATGASSQVPENTEERLKALEERLRALEAEIQALKARRDATPTAAPEAQAPAVPAPPVTVQTPAGAPGVASGQLPVYGGPTALAKILNPDISVIGNFWGSIGNSPVRPISSLEMHETEIALQAIVDPYARADFFVSLSREGIELEEGYLTFPALPGGFVAKVGKMRAAFGKVNALHNDGLPWIDRPLVTDSLVAGEEGINDAGLSLSRILPAPKGIFLEATGQVFRGDSDDLFASNKRSDVSFVGHLRGYGDLSESTNLDLGFSYARGHNDLGSRFLTQLYGIDATFRWKPLRRAIYHSFLARTELVWSQREQLTRAEKAFGFYTSADYRLNRRWTLGGRFDRTGRARDPSLTDSGFSALLTYWPSEFSQIRGQYRFARYTEGRDGNELRFQFLFNLGVHGAHPF